MKGGSKTILPGFKCNLNFHNGCSLLSLDFLRYDGCHLFISSYSSSSSPLLVRLLLAI